MKWFRSYYSGPISSHFDGKRFFNPWNRRVHTTFMTFLKWKIASRPKDWPDFVSNGQFDTPPPKVEGSFLRASFVGHSTMLVQTQGLNILCDPIWSEYGGPVKMTMTKRRHEPGILFDNLPKIDLVLISHNHYDHLDLKTVQQLWRRDRPLILTPLGNDTIIQSYDSSILVETLDWDQSRPFTKEVAVHLIPAQHWSSRGLWDWDKALWGAFVISTPGGNIYFAGDTGYGKGEVFQHARKKFGSFRFAMLPVGIYEPRWFMHYVHMNPADAVLAYRDLGEPYTLGMHLGTFQLADDGYDDPWIELERERKAHNIPEEKFKTLKPGQSWMVPKS